MVAPSPLNGHSCPTSPPDTRAKSQQPPWPQKHLQSKTIDITEISHMIMHLCLRYLKENVSLKFQCIAYNIGLCHIFTWSCLPHMSCKGAVIRCKWSCKANREFSPTSSINTAMIFTTLSLLILVSIIPVKWLHKSVLVILEDNIINLKLLHQKSVHKSVDYNEQAILTLLIKVIVGSSHIHQSLKDLETQNK